MVLLYSRTDLNIAKSQYTRVGGVVRVDGEVKGRFRVNRDDGGLGKRGVFRGGSSRAYPVCGPRTRFPCGALVATVAVLAFRNEGRPLWPVKIRAVQFIHSSLFHVLFLSSSNSFSPFLSCSFSLLLYNTRGVALCSLLLRLLHSFTRLFPPPFEIPWPNLYIPSRFPLDYIVPRTSKTKVRYRVESWTVEQPPSHSCTHTHTYTRTQTETKQPQRGYFTQRSFSTESTSFSTYWYPLNSLLKPQKSLRKPTWTIWPHPHSTEYCRNMSEIFPIFHCTWNIVAKILSNIAKYFTVTLKF